MFSWSKKKTVGKREKSSEENEFGIKTDKGDDKELEAELRALTGVDELGDDMAVNEGDEDIEAELLRLMGKGKGKKQPKKVSNVAVTGKPAEIIQDIEQDMNFEDEETNDEDIDENDPELLGELMELTQLEDKEESEEESEPEEKIPNGESNILSTLKERLSLYKTAVAKAKENNESSRARRFNRGIKNIESLIKEAKAGKPVSPDEIPPIIALNLKPAPPPSPSVGDEECNRVEEDSVVAVNNETANDQQEDNIKQEEAEENILQTLTERLKMYRTAEINAKEKGETSRARRFGRGIKTLENLLKQAKSGESVSLSDIPPAVALNLKSPEPASPPSVLVGVKNLDDGEEGAQDEMRNVNLSINPSDTAEVVTSKEEPQNIKDILSERLKNYNLAVAKARQDNEGTRARRFERGIKTLQDLIRQANAGYLISPDAIPPQVALNLQPAPVYVNTEEKLTECLAKENEILIRSGVPAQPLVFRAVEDVDLEKDLKEENIPLTVLEGLEQRLRIFKELQEKAILEGNKEDAEYYKEIVKLYLSTISNFKKGDNIDVETLPTTDECPPIPVYFQLP